MSCDWGSLTCTEGRVGGLVADHVRLAIPPFRDEFPSLDEAILSYNENRVNSYHV